MAQKRDQGGKLQLEAGQQTKARMIIVDIFFKSLFQKGNQAGNMQLGSRGQRETKTFILNKRSIKGSKWKPGVLFCSCKWEYHRRTLICRPVTLKYAYSRLTETSEWEPFKLESFYFKGVREKAGSPAGFLLSSCSSITKLLHKLLQLATSQ